jgi:hypothetical protein
MTKISPCLGMQNYAWKRIGFQVSTYQKTCVSGYGVKSCFASFDVTLLL